jgi:GrpE.
MVRVESDHPEDTISEVYEPGYETDDTVIEPAKVTVSDGSGSDPDTTGEGDTEAADDTETVDDDTDDE